MKGNIFEKKVITCSVASPDNELVIFKWVLTVGSAKTLDKTYAKFKVPEHKKFDGIQIVKDL